MQQRTTFREKKGKKGDLRALTGGEKKKKKKRDNQGIIPDGVKGTRQKDRYPREKRRENFRGGGEEKGPHRSHRTPKNLRLIKGGGEEEKNVRQRGRGKKGCSALARREKKERERKKTWSTNVKGVRRLPSLFGKSKLVPKKGRGKSGPGRGRKSRP